MSTSNVPLTSLAQKTRSFPAGLAISGLILFFSVPQAMAQNRPHEKISPLVFVHQKTKQKPATRTLWEHRALLLAEGLNPDNLEAEVCALYTSNRLSKTEISDLKAKGISVVPDLWIPPVTGHHPTGFHLATVNYTSLGIIQADARFVSLESAELQNKPMNDAGCALINADDVHNGNGVTACTGAGVLVAVADSGVDLTHSDIPTPVEAYDMTDGSSVSTWGTNVSNTVSAHGTHVTGTVVGRGTLSNGKYGGSAPGANLCFYKIGNDSTGSATDADMIEAINRAVTVGAKVFTMSYGGFSTYMDGSESVEQAIDAAVADGMTVFISAGNEATAALHDSVSVAPNTTSTAFPFVIDNSSSSQTYSTAQYIQVIWIDGTIGDYNVSLSCTNLTTKGGPGGESLTLVSSSYSNRGTESRQYKLTPSVSGTSSKTYYFQLSNSDTSGSAPLIHCYQISGKGTFGSADASYTVGHPAVADGAIAVGAWVQRKQWTNYQGYTYYYTSGETGGTLATFSSRGPRIDGVRKPEIVAPGSATISARDSVSGLAAIDALIIDNDGLSLDGSGPANYYVMQGTSMASPMAAGIAALILEKHPSFTPAQVRTALTNTASTASSPNNSVGYGLIDALAAVNYTPDVSVTLTVVSGHGGASPGTVSTNSGSLLGQWVTNSPVAVGVSTQYVCLSGTVLSNAYTQVSATNVTLTLTNDAALTWNWQTQYLLTAQTNGSGSVTAADGWYASGANVALTATPAAYWHFAGWTGDTNGCPFADNVLTASMTQARTVMANFAETLAPQGTPEAWLAQYGLTGDPAAEELTDTDGDGLSAWEEYVADTDPTNPVSVLAFTGLAWNGGSLRIDWKGGHWSKQYIDARTDLADTNANWSCIYTNDILPTAISNSLIRTDTAQPAQFYRIRVER